MNKCADDLYNCCNSICIRTILADKIFNLVMWRNKDDRKNKKVF